MYVLLTLGLFVGDLISCVWQLQKELSVAMALTGTTRVSDVGPQVLVNAAAKKPARKRTS
jgi:isopentenyl diphosphate isomerase/L-lactate dehydrogenase-like FMN-dependent dehydrogenase